MTYRLNKKKRSIQQLLAGSSKKEYKKLLKMHHEDLKTISKARKENRLLKKQVKRLKKTKY
jgi:hypothetical protein